MSEHTDELEPPTVLDDEDDGDDEFDDVDELPPAPEAPAPPPVAAAPAPAPARPRQRRSRARPPQAPVGAGAPEVSPSEGRPRGRIGGVSEKDWQPEIEFLWPRILAELPKINRSAYDMAIRVVRLEPVRQVLSPPIQAAAVMGSASQSPGDALTQYIEDYYHMQTARGPVLYELCFYWKVDGTMHRRGTFQASSPAEIMGLRNAAMQRQIGEGPPPAFQPGMGAQAQPPHVPPTPYAPGYPPPPYGAGYPPPPYGMGYPQGPYMGGYPPPPDPHGDPRERELRDREDEISILREQLRRANANAGPAPAPVPSPPAGAGLGAQADLVEAVVARVLGALGRGGPTGGAAPAAAVPPAAVASETRSGVAALRELVATMKELKGLGTSIDEVFHGPREEEEDDPPPAAAPVGVGATPAAEPAEKPDFVVSDLGAWGDGRTSKIVRDRESRDIRVAETVLANPWLVEQGLEKLGGAAGDILTRLMSQQAGGGTGVGAPQQQEQKAAPLTGNPPDPKLKEAAPTEAEKDPSTEWDFG